MPELLDVNYERELQSGDVLMVSRKMKDKATRKRFDWKFFMVVLHHDFFSDAIEGMVIGASNENLKDRPMRLDIDHERNTIHYLPPDEWPDGVHAFRMGMILKGQIKGIV